MKPILFNSEMVRAIQEGRKIVTRRVVKPQPKGQVYRMPQSSAWPNYFGQTGSDAVFSPKYRPGDILYVRETWQEVYETEHDADGSKRTVNIRDLISNFDDIPKVEAGISHDCATAIMEPRMKYYVFKASDIRYADPANGLRWSPSIHMPRKAARLFLRVTDVRVERLLSMLPCDIQKEGCPYVYSGFDEEQAPDWDGWMKKVWGSTIKTADRAIYGWDTNPWVWVIEFESISKEEAERC